MKARNIILMAAIAVLSLSCTKDRTDYSKYYPNYILTCKTNDAGTFYLQLDDNTTALPKNVGKPLFGGKEVRALANITDLPGTQGKTVDLTLKYDTRDGQKSIKYKYCSGKPAGETTKQSVEGVDLSLRLE